MKVDFKHRQRHIVKTGWQSICLRFHGIDISEPMAFGIAPDLFLPYAVFESKRNGSYFFPRLAGVIFRRVTRRLGIKIRSRKFRDPDKADASLDNLLRKEFRLECLLSISSSIFPQRIQVPI